MVLRYSAIIRIIIIGAFIRKFFIQNFMSQASGITIELLLCHSLVRSELS